MAPRERPGNGEPLPAEQIVHWLRTLVEPGSVVELRALGCDDGRGYTRDWHGYFDTEHLDQLAAAALELTSRSEGVYWTLNPVEPALLARACNRVRQLSKGGGTADKYIVRRRWLLVDLDPQRPTGISATDAEKAWAYKTAQAVRDYLHHDAGWPAPIEADSGNGYHQLYRIDLLREDGGLVKRCLQALAVRFDSEQVKIDLSVFNPSRITKLYGTWARKGDSIPDRPHRLSRLLEVPALVEVVTEAQLQSLAAEAPEPANREASANPEHNGTHASGGRSRLDVPRWLTARGVGFTDAGVSDGWRRWRLDHCPFNPEHTGKDVAIFQGPDGQLGARCLHSSCQGKGWQEFKRAIGKPDSDHYDPPLGRRRTARPSPNGHGPPEQTGPGQRQPAARIIREYWQRCYDPTFRRGLGTYSAILGREVRAAELQGAPTSELIGLLAGAAEAARDGNGDAIPGKLPTLFTTWAKVAWGDLLAELPEQEGGGGEIVLPAQEEFRRHLTAALLYFASLGRTHKGDDGEPITLVERRPLLDWAQIFAKEGSWGDVRGHRIWSRVVKANELDRDFQVAIRVELFTQTGPPELACLTQRQFTELCGLYGLGLPCKVRGGDERAIRLAPEFLADLLAEPASEDPPAQDDPTDGRTDAHAHTHASAHTHARERPSVRVCTPDAGADTCTPADN